MKWHFMVRGFDSLGIVCNSHQVLHSKVIDLQCSVASLIQRLNKAVNDLRWDQAETARLLEETASLAYSTSKQHQHVIMHWAEQKLWWHANCLSHGPHFKTVWLWNRIPQKRNSSFSDIASSVNRIPQKRNVSFDIFRSVLQLKEEFILKTTLCSAYILSYIL